MADLSSLIYIDISWSTQLLFTTEKNLTSLLIRPHHHVRVDQRLNPVVLFLPTHCIHVSLLD
jgi:hypothetical protein